MEIEPVLSSASLASQASAAQANDWLKAEIWQALVVALQSPAETELSRLYIALDNALMGRPLAIQLQIAGTVLAQLAEIYTARFDLSIATWESQHQPLERLEPIIDLESCIDLFVQSLSLNVSELFEAAPPVQYPHHRKQARSRVAEVEQDSRLQWADQMAERANWETGRADNADLSAQIRQLAHDENVEQWSGAIRAVLSASEPSQGNWLYEMQAQVELPLIELWLGLLLGGYQLEQQGDFYDGQSIWIINSF